MSQMWLICPKCGQYVPNVANMSQMWLICPKCGQYVPNVANMSQICPHIQVIIRLLVIGPNLDLKEAVLEKGNVAAAICEAGFQIGIKFSKVFLSC